ncbi:DUF6033 family protein [Paenibacillus sp. HW567]|uniref:DUF6033 family protein n=1 Tax=Paenibacillus sp. HW567 TaxID=1034769 RepID=UPI000368EFB4|nr:DUF6033 family protein [Paenibacillus sp. HW567]
MNIPINGINPISLTRPPQQQEIKASTEISPLSFTATLAAVTAASQAQVQRIKRRYGLNVGILSVDSDEKEIADHSAGDSLPELVIAPNILQQMARDIVLSKKVYGYIDDFINEDPKGLNHMGQKPGMKTTGRSLIIHMDGTFTVLGSSSAASPEEAGKQQELKKKVRETSGGLQAFQPALPVLSRNLLPLQGDAHSVSDAVSVREAPSQEWLHQILLMRAIRSHRGH